VHIKAIEQGDLIPVLRTGGHLQLQLAVVECGRGLGIGQYEREKVLEDNLLVKIH